MVNVAIRLHTSYPASHLGNQGRISELETGNGVNQARWTPEILQFLYGIFRPCPPPPAARGRPPKSPRSFSGSKRHRPRPGARLSWPACRPNWRGARDRRSSGSPCGLKARSRQSNTGRDPAGGVPWPGSRTSMDEE